MFQRIKRGNKEMECCVLCGTRTGYAKDTPIHERVGYVEGAGQLCMACCKAVYGLGPDDDRP